MPVINRLVFGIISAVVFAYSFSKYIELMNATTHTLLEDVTYAVCLCAALISGAVTQGWRDRSYTLGAPAAIFVVLGVGQAINPLIGALFGFVTGASVVVCMSMLVRREAWVTGMQIIVVGLIAFLAGILASEKGTNSVEVSMLTKIVLLSASIEVSLAFVVIQKLRIKQFVEHRDG